MGSRCDYHTVCVCVCVCTQERPWISVFLIVLLIEVLLG